MQKILIFDTVIGTSNLGDQVIYDSLYEQMSTLFDNSFVIKYGTHLKNFSPYLYARMRYKRNLVDSCDYKFIMGTNLLSYNLYETRRQWMVDMSNYGLYKNIILAGVGTTQEERKIGSYTKFLYKKILNNKIVHSVRDDQSVRLLNSLGYNAINTGCPTLWKLTADFCREIPTDKSDNVVFSVSGYIKQKNPKYDQVLIDTIERCYEKIYFWCQTSEDENYLNTLKHKKPIEVVYSINSYRKILQNGNVDYIGTRLHGGVFALQNKVRSIVISIDHRARGFNETNNFPILERNQIDSLDEMIHSSFCTKINLNTESIAKWKAQFGI